MQKGMKNNLINTIVENLNIDFEMLFRLVLAAILGLLMGIERELKRKSLGLKTIIVISIVSSLLTIVSIQAAYIFPSTTTGIDIRMDPLRLAAQIVSGVGFLGAGVILRRGDDTVTGLTTAAIVWGAAGIGIATGAGFYIEAIVGVLLLLISVELIPFLIKKAGVKALDLTEIYLKVSLKDREKIQEVLNEIKKNVVEVKDVDIQDVNDEKYLITLRIIVRVNDEITDIYNRISEIKQIDKIEIKS